MQTGAITQYIDVAQLTLYAFWIFFAGLILYLRGEDKREGYPLESTTGRKVVVQGFPGMPRPKTFLLPHGGTVTAPRHEAPEPILHARQAEAYVGAPWDPTGHPLRDGVGPAAYANRADHPDLTWDEGIAKIVPLRVATGFSLAPEDPDPRGMEVIGADNQIAGHIVDAWVDRAEAGVRYLEIALTANLVTSPPNVPVNAAPASTGTVLVPMNLVQFTTRRRLKVRSIRAEDFATVPRLKHPEQITLLEEDMITAYYGGGALYALPERMGPVL